jgi:hypothetical protein
VYVADLSADDTHITTPRRLTLNEGRNYPCAWTADSKAVVFGSYLDGQWRIFKQRLDEETSEPITTRQDGDVVRARVSRITSGSERNRFFTNARSRLSRPCHQLALPKVEELEIDRRTRRRTQEEHRTADPAQRGKRTRSRLTRPPRY